MDRAECPNARFLAYTLFDLAREHDSVGLEDLAIRVDREFAQRGVEVEEHFVHAVMDMASAIFGE